MKKLFFSLVVAVFCAISFSSCVSTHSFLATDANGDTVVVTERVYYDTPAPTYYYYTPSYPVVYTPYYPRYYYAPRYYAPRPPRHHHHRHHHR